MAKTESKTKSDGYVFTTGVNLSDGTRYEKGDAVPEDIPAKDRAALVEMKAIAPKETN